MARVATNKSRGSRVYTGEMAVKTAAFSTAMDTERPATRIDGLFDRHHERLYRLARRLCSNIEDAKDLVQETYLRAAQRLNSVPQGLTAEEAWLVRVLVNLCRDRWRRDEVRRRLRQPEQVRACDTEGALIARSTIWRALESVSPRRRAVLVMCELEGLPIASVARSLGVTSVTVRWHLSRGRRELARFISNSKSENHDG